MVLRSYFLVSFLGAAAPVFQDMLRRAAGITVGAAAAVSLGAYLTSTKPTVDTASKSDSTSIASSLNMRPNPEDESRVKDLDLKSVQVFFRHGARTPLRPVAYLKEEEWPKSLLDDPSLPSFTYSLQGLGGKTIPRSPHDAKFEKIVFKGGAWAGQLTTLGKEQLHDLGKRMRKEYIEERDFLSPTLDSTQVYIRSTNIFRNVQSAQWLISGMFEVPPGSSGKPAVIWTDLDQDEILYPNFSHCMALKNVNKRFFKAVDDIPDIEKDRLIHSTRLNFGGTDTKIKKLDYQELRDELSARIAHGIYVPDEVIEMMDRINEHSLAMLTLSVTGSDPSEQEQVLGLACGAVLQMITDNIDAAAKGATFPRLHLYATHDSLMMAFLLSLGIADGKWPPFASDLIFESYQDKIGADYVRVLYLGKPRQLGVEKSEIVTLNRFKEIITPYGLSIDKYRELCAVSAGEEEGGEVMDVIGGSTK